ncbi:hypothetical protein F2Q69_00062140 [Brassica cretica]|uniref:Uncharacterized protein n=1 Tax=Brassica cretica TaxID=69181 RepID=A0A8S9RLZ2_BRACR|nr:hypothetical protein F2Q69_00062140 [Brassica cretica]
MWLNLLLPSSDGGSRPNSCLHRYWLKSSVHPVPVGFRWLPIDFQRRPSSQCTESVFSFLDACLLFVHVVSSRIVSELSIGLSPGVMLALLCNYYVAFGL